MDKRLRAHSLNRKRKSQIALRRERQIEEVAPLLRSMRWRKVVAGRARLDGIEAFIENYRMYVPLLAGHREALEYARDSGLYEYFDLYASSRFLAVEGVTSTGRAKPVMVVSGHFWEDSYSFAPLNYTPW